MLGSMRSARSAEEKTSTSALPSCSLVQIDDHHRNVRKPARAAAEPPGHKSHADGEQERRQQHEDQRGAVAEDELEVFDADEK